MSRLGCGCLVAVWLLAAQARADEYYADPERGSMSNDGSASSPWGSLEAITAAGLFGTTIAAGDTLFLRAGHHGAFSLRSGAFEPAIVIEAEPGGAMPELSRVSVSGASGVVLRGVSISPSYAESYERGTIVELRDSSSKITIEDCDVFSEADVSGWGAGEWVDRASSGFEVSGDDIVGRTA